VPFLKDAVVRYCSVFRIQEMIAQVPGHEGEESVPAASYADCSVARSMGSRSQQSRAALFSRNRRHSIARLPPSRSSSLQRREFFPLRRRDHRVCELYVAHQRVKRAQLELACAR